jgi:hypothetical protein
MSHNAPNDLPAPSEWRLSSKGRESTCSCQIHNRQLASSDSAGMCKRRLGAR